ncbi:hypothetical protein CPB84DRAFT_1798216 [Gymnopilus junonius]|uniref:DUF5648 domain-containing protein n=1 Tax=Gymnopilus junonius TaxID=109634 RepID=A0A9P5N9Y5_GYMJU|nr:hypothetical protein CPB84DRAFT_1798216 [Gymnopilus junonius]
MKGFLFAVLSFNILGGISSTAEYLKIQHRESNTCADPNLTQTYTQAYSPSQTAHAIDVIYDFVNANAHGTDWQIQRDTFLAWRTPQEFTVPLYVLNNPTTHDFIYLMSTDGMVPTASAFNVGSIIAYVYPTQICGSVPLFALFQDVVSDHWYTTGQTERAGFVESGWIDSGIAAYVLPLSS